MVAFKEANASRRTQVPGLTTDSPQPAASAICPKAIVRYGRFSGGSGSRTVPRKHPPCPTLHRRPVPQEAFLGDQRAAGKRISPSRDSSRWRHTAGYRLVTRLERRRHDAGGETIAVGDDRLERDFGRWRVGHSDPHRSINHCPLLKGVFILPRLSRIAYLVVPRRLQGERRLRRFSTNRTRAASAESTCSNNAHWTSTIFVAWPPSYSPTASIFMPICCWQNWLT